MSVSKKQIEEWITELQVEVTTLSRSCYPGARVLPMRAGCQYSHIGPYR